MSVKMKDIARYAGISTATVSLALQDKPCVAEATRRRIQQLAESLGYTPSGIGRALQSGRSNLIGYALHSVDSSFFSEIMQGIGAEAAKRGYGLLAAITGGSPAEMASQIRIFREKRIEGLISSVGDNGTLTQISDMERAGCPAVFCSLESPLPNVPAAVTDDRLGGRMAGEHLAERGARRIAFFTTRPFNPADSSSNLALRQMGCAEAMADSGLPALRLFLDEHALAAALKEPRRSRPDAIFAFCDDDAVSVKQCADAAGLRIPDDLLLVGFDNSKTASLPEYSLSSMAPQKRSIGECAVRMLLDRIAGRQVGTARLAPSLVTRKSTKSF